MRKSIFTFVLLAISFSVFAQSYTARVLVLNEGYYDYISGEILEPVTVGSFDPSTATYTTLHTIAGARFASDIVIAGDVYFVAADDQLLKYDLATDALLDAAEVQGIRKVAVTDEQVIVTRGEYMVELPAYVQVYDLNTLDLAYEISADVLPHTTEGVSIQDGKAYIAVNNGFIWGEEVGYIAVLDLATQTIAQTIDLGVDGINPDNLMMEGEYIYTLNNKDFTGSSVSAYRMTTGEISTTNLANISSGCGTSAIQSGTIYYQELFGTTVSRFDAGTATILGEDEYGVSFYGLDFDPVSGYMYTSETDFFSYGTVHAYDADMNIVYTFNAGVSPGNFAFDVRLEAGISEQEVAHVQVYPNPVVDHFTVDAGLPIEQLIICDITGKQLMQVQGNAQTQCTVGVEGIPAGLYTLTTVFANGSATEVFQK